MLGSVVNWALGFLFKKSYLQKSGFHFNEAQIERSSKWFIKFGKWSLLFAWVPVVGDPLTLAAGLLRIRFLDFIILVAIGKVSRYVVIFYLIG